MSKTLEGIRTDFTPIPTEEFAERTAIDVRTLPGCSNAEWIISTRDITIIRNVILMPNEHRDQLLLSIGAAYDRSRKVYLGCKVEHRTLDASEVLVGQKYVYRQNYVSIVEGVRDLLRGFSVTRGFTRHIGCVVVGESADGQTVIGHYLPPIVEEHNGRYFLMDGVHRTYLARQAGVPIECLLVKDVSLTFPCTPHRWRDIEVVEEKPKLAQERYFDLDQNLFRDVKWSGIDG